MCQIPSKLLNIIIVHFVIFVLNFSTIKCYLGGNRATSEDELIFELDRPTPVVDVQGVLTKKATLPCDITPHDKHDTVSMVLWFKESSSEPLYRFDVRGRQFTQAKMWSAPHIFGARAFFRVTTTPAQLMVDNIHVEDEGVYRCRVDFKNSPTRNLKINFTVIIPPERPVIVDSQKQEKTQLLEPYNEGDDVQLICEVIGGRPQPRVTWFLENTIIDDSYEIRNENLVINHLSFPSVGRQHLNARLICQASNTNLAPPASKVLILNINLKPLTVTILTKEKSISADKRYEVECRTSGSRPEAVITWWKGNHQIKRMAKNFAEAGNQSLSILAFTPTIEDDGKYLTCRAENPLIPESALEDRWRLNVRYLPIVSLKMGSSLNPDDIKEGDDVYFECNVKSNPKAYKLAWYLNGKELHHNVSAGVILSDQSLVLQGVTRAAAGDYICLAANSEGKGTSNPQQLKVRYVPICKDDHEELLGALKQETVILRCEVDANPPLVSFHWTFNNSGDLTEVPPSRFTAEGTISHLNYTPISDMDYGTLSCWGQNAVGHQKSPCVFQVVTAGKPFKLLNCSIVNQTTDSIQIECLENFDGGLPQSFFMEILELPLLRSKYNQSTHTAPPKFNIEGIEPGLSYQVNLYAVNAKGRSEPVIIESVTFKGVAKLQGSSASMQISPLLTSLIAILIVLLSGVCLGIIALFRRKSHRHHLHNHGHITSKHIQMEILNRGEESPLNGNDDQRSNDIGGYHPHPIDGHLNSAPLHCGSRDGSLNIEYVGGTSFNGDHIRNSSSQDSKLNKNSLGKYTDNISGSLQSGTLSTGFPRDNNSPATEPDIIRNQYVDRRPVLSFMTVYEPASSIPGEDDEELEDEERNPYKSNQQPLKRLYSPTKNMYLSLRGDRATTRMNKGVTAISPLDRGPTLVGPTINSGNAIFPSLIMPVSSTLTLQKHKPEVVTTSNRIQESCI
ncbi:neural cell adhesion molecule 1 [Chrysoperla carnea]|uniref:neural cell adhesion molecule 1 n=1 Tax=Chrysoperla carnea TaxID=189513 RepID=UPI001D08D66B|nr:neural cell adhesion molecule 1 [Chrysoperla carnea]